MVEEHWASPSLRILSSVPRWGIVRVLQRQSVADHSFYVAVYADALADLLGWGPEHRAHLLRSALWHDVDEIVSGDIPGPVKRQIPERAKWSAYVNSHVTRHFGYDYPDVLDEEKPILTAANLLDECAYLAGESRLGNQNVARALYLSRRRLKESCDQLGLPQGFADQFVEKHILTDTPLPGDEVVRNGP